MSHFHRHTSSKHKYGLGKRVPGYPVDTTDFHRTERKTDTDSSGLSRDTPPQPQTPAVSPAPSGSGGSSGGMGFVMGTINSAIALVKNPVGYITANKDTPTSVREIMVNYVAVLAAIPFLATLIGDLWYYSLFSVFRFAGSFYAYAFTAAILGYILDVIAVYVIAIIIRMLAPTFNSTVDEIKSLKLAAYIYTPVFLVGVLNIIPLLGFVAILGVLYGLYILYLGLPIVLGTAKEKVVSYVVAVVIATFVVYLVFGAIVGAITASLFLASFGFFF